MIAIACAGIILGMLIGKFFRAPLEDCPRCVLGYNCMGDWCDHRQSELYRAEMEMALGREQLETNKNMWGGDA